MKEVFGLLLTEVDTYKHRYR